MNISVKYYDTDITFLALSVRMGKKHTKKRRKG